MAIYIGSSKKTIRVGSSFSRILLIPELVNIAVTTPPIKTKYNHGEVFDPTGMVVTAEYDNGTTKVVTDYTILNGDQLSENMTTVNISYTERGVTAGTVYEVVVLPPMATLTITTERGGSSDIKGDKTYININADVAPFPQMPDYIANPFKIDCYYGSSSYTILVPVGTVINCRVEDDAASYAKINLNGTKVSTSTYDYIVSGDATIVLQASSVGGSEYGRISITDASGVVPNVLVSIAVTTPPTKTEYYTGEAFDPAGMVVTATYSDGTTADVTGYIITNGDNLSVGSQTITISYTESGLTFRTSYVVEVDGPEKHVDQSSGEILDSWSVISIGTYRHYYSLGNYKNFSTTDGITVTMQIVAFDADECEDGTKAPITWIAEDICWAGQHSSTTTQPSYGWTNSLIRPRLQSGGDIYNSIPSEVMNVIKTVKKYDLYWHSSKDFIETRKDKLWIPNYREIFGGISYEHIGAEYTAYFNSDSIRAKRDLNNTANYWWLRTVNTDSIGFWCVNSSGIALDRETPNHNYGVVIGFCT